MERRSDYVGLHERLAAIEVIAAGTNDEIKRLTERMLGNGRPGFIQETNESIHGVKSWQVAHDAEDEVTQRNRKKSMVLWGSLIAGGSWILDYLGHFFSSFFSHKP